MIRSWLAILVVIACVLTGAVSAFGQTGKTKDIKGVVEELDATVGTITLVVEDGTGGKARYQRVKTFNLVKPGLPIVDAEGKALKLQDLKAGRRVFLQMDRDDVVAIRLAPPTLFGTLGKINLADGTIVVNSKIGGKTLFVPPSAKVRNSTQIIALKDLKPGALVLVSFSEDQKNVLEVRTGKSVQPLARLVAETGYLIELDRNKPAMKIFVNTHLKDGSFLHHLTFDKEPSIGLMYLRRPHRDLTLAEVHPGVRLRFWIDYTSRALVHLEIEMPTLASRTIKAIDPATRQLILEDPDGDRVLTASPHIKVYASGRPALLTDLRPGMQILCGLAPDRRSVEVVTYSKNE